MLAASGKQACVKPLTALLQDENVAVREAVAKALGELGGEASVNPLVSCLKDEAWSVRATALQSLGRLGELAPIEPLVASLEDEDVSVRLAAVRALEKQAKRVPLEVFVAALGDKEELVCGAALEVMERLLEHPEQCVLTDTLVGALIGKTRSEENDVRLAAMRFLGMLATYALTKGASTIQGGKANIVYEILWKGREQRGQNSVEPILFLPRNGVMHPGMFEYGITLALCRKISPLLERSNTVSWAPRCLAGSYKKSFPIDNMRADLLCRLQDTIVCFECKKTLNSNKDGSRYPEFGKQETGWQTQHRSTDFLICLFSVESRLEELRRSAWSIFGTPDPEKADVLMRLLFLLLRSGDEWSQLYRFMEPLLSLQRERQASIKIPGEMSVLSLANVIADQLSIVTRANNENAEANESLVPLVQNLSAGSRIPLYTPEGLYQGGVPAFR